MTTVTLTRRPPMPSFSTLRELAETPAVRPWIKARADQIAATGWDIVPSVEASRAMRGNHQAMVRFSDRRDDALAFFRHPDGNYPGFRSWLTMIARDLLIIDAVTLYLHKSKDGASIAALDLLDGARFEPVLCPDLRIVGWHLYGSEVGRRDAFKVMTEPTPAPVAVYEPGHILAPVFSARSWTTFGMPPLEQAWVPGDGGEPHLDEDLIPQAFGMPEGSSVEGGTLAPDRWLKARLDWLAALFEAVLLVLGYPDLRWKWEVPA